MRLLDPDNGADALWLSPTPEIPASQFYLGTRPRLVNWHTFALAGCDQQFVFGTTHLEAVNACDATTPITKVVEHIRLAYLDWYHTQLEQPANYLYTGTIGCSKVLHMMQAPGNCCMNFAHNVLIKPLSMFTI